MVRKLNSGTSRVKEWDGGVPACDRKLPQRLLSQWESTSGETKAPSTLKNPPVECRKVGVKSPAESPLDCLS